MMSGRCTGALRYVAVRLTRRTARRQRGRRGAAIFAGCSAAAADFDPRQSGRARGKSLVSPRLGAAPVLHRERCGANCKPARWRRRLRGARHVYVRQRIECQQSVRLSAVAAAAGTIAERRHGRAIRSARRRCLRRIGQQGGGARHSRGTATGVARGTSPASGKPSPQFGPQTLQALLALQQTSGSGSPASAAIVVLAARKPTAQRTTERLDVRDASRAKASAAIIATIIAWRRKRRGRRRSKFERQFLAALINGATSQTIANADGSATTTTLADGLTA